jgi:multimeric flavodoxin WrbA
VAVPLPLTAYNLLNKSLAEDVTVVLQDESIPFADAHTLDQADGFLFGIPTRFGNMAGQFKTFWDSTGQLWMQGLQYSTPPQKASSVLDTL